ncbi:sensor histidine kinase [Herminiimonas arsenitoxidans]|uniref:sensor histidine kinase n=1 Tax=Herminiimonas arsenitoxidans TaxID=1809410 RepID=UPI000970EC10|nr:HAMP domain-containing sensor histidine kinase [Herminiimonas arsenitoxidans]
MKRPSTIRRRIVVAYLFFALAVCTFVGVIASVAIVGIEDLLVDEHLRSIAAWASPRHAAGMPVEMPSDVNFYHGPDIPPELRDLPQGVVKKTFDGQTVHLLVGQDAEGTYVVLDRASEYKNIEHVIYAMLGAGFLGFVALSLFLGTFIARGFVDPIIKLAAAVMDKKSKAELPLLNNQDELGILARSFAAHTAELKQFLARERFFTGDVSHELRTPLTIIIGASELLVEQTATQPALHAPAQRILRAAKEATNCVGVLLLLARRPDTIDRPLTSISEVIRSEIERGQPLVRDRPISLHFQEGKDFSVFGRKELLSSAIGNLIRNACEYTDEGSVVVSIQDHSVLVEDTGPGVPDIIRARLKNDPSQPALIGSAGSGLGLALAIRICEYLGAKLEHDDRPQGGSIFRIHFQSVLTEN